jgi:hypothetical protein
VHKEEGYVIVFTVLSYFKLEAGILSQHRAVPSRENADDFDIYTSKVQGARIAQSV